MVSVSAYFIFDRFFLKTDYGCTFIFSVVNGNGIVTPADDELKDIPSPFERMGAKEDVSVLEFEATPDFGYKVKEWTYMGEIIEGHVSNFYTTPLNYPTLDLTVYITVEFEPTEANEGYRKFGKSFETSSMDYGYTEALAGFGCGDNCGHGRKRGLSVSLMTGCKNWQLIPMFIQKPSRLPPRRRPFAPRPPVRA